MGEASPPGWQPDENQSLYGNETPGGPESSAPGGAPLPPMPWPQSFLPPPMESLVIDGVTIPFARPASMEIGFAGIELVNFPRLRALLEILAVVGGTFLGSLVITVVLALILHTRDERDISIPATFLLGTLIVTLCLSLLAQKKLPLRSIGFSTHRLGSNVLLGLGSFLAVTLFLLSLVMALYFTFPSFWETLARHGEETSEAIKAVIPKTSTGEMFLFLSFVAFWEELVFRGFLLTRLKVLLKSWWLVVPVGALLFGMGHMYEGGILGVFKTAVLGMVFGAMFAWRKSLIPGMVFHLAWNMSALLSLNAQP